MSVFFVATFVRRSRTLLQQPPPFTLRTVRSCIHTLNADWLSLRGMIDDVPIVPRDIILSRCAPGLGREPAARPIICRSFCPFDLDAANSSPPIPLFRHHPRFSSPLSRTPVFRT